MFATIWGQHEKAYSGVMAQSLILSKCLRRAFHSWAGIDSKSSTLARALTEHSLSEEKGIIDILLEYEEGFYIGIENKKWATLQNRQLERYLSSVELSSNSSSFLILLCPSQYQVPLEQKALDVRILHYEEVISWVNAAIESTGGMERFYLENLRDYLKDIEMAEISREELASLTHYSAALAKLDKILVAIRDDGDGQIENSAGQLKLFWRHLGKYYVYIGFRFGNNWYFKDALLAESPEVVIYVKDSPDLQIDNEDREKLQKVSNKVRDIIKPKYPRTIVSYHTKRSSVEPRLSIQQSLLDFADLPPSDIVAWFVDCYEALRKCLHKDAAES